jgi:hypothetical protein
MLRPAGLVFRASVIRWARLVFRASVIRRAGVIFRTSMVRPTSIAGWAKIVVSVVIVVHVIVWPISTVLRASTSGPAKAPASHMSDAKDRGPTVFPEQIA